MKGKKFLAFFIALALLISMVPISASASTVTNIYVGNVSAEQGDTVLVPVSLSSGSQMQAFSFSLEYDKNVLEVVSANKGSILSATPIINTNIAGKIVFSYAATSAVVSAGAVLNITFKIKENAPYGESYLKLNVNEFADGGFTTIDHTTKNGCIVVIAPKLEPPAEILLKGIDDTHAEILWTGNDEATGYNIYLNGSLYNNEPLTDNLFQFTELEQNTRYQVQVTTLNYTTESDKTDIFIFETKKTHYDVLFVDWNYNVFDVIEGSVLYATRVEHGASATPPSTPEREGYRFVSWDVDFSEVISDLVIQAQYEPISNTVTFVDWDGTVLSTQTIAYGQSAVAPAEPSRDGYSFVSWDKEFDNVTEDLTVTAQYEATCDHTNTKIEGAIESTCKTAGFSGNMVCSDCGETVSFGTELELADHSYKSVVTPPTSSSQGYTTHTCTVCGDSYVDSYVDFVDENAPQIVVDTKTATAGNTVDVKISLKNNPGILSATMKVAYDSSALTLTKVTDAGVLGTASHRPILVNPYTLTWVNDSASSNFTANGAIVTLTFTVKDGTAVGSYPVTVSYNYDDYDIYNKNAEKVRFTAVNGAVEVVKENDINDFTYTVSGSNLTITGYKGTVNDIIISSKYTIGGKEYTVTKIAMEAFLGQETITSVVIPETVTEIGEAAFYDCYALTNVTVLNKNAAIGDVAMGYYYASRREYVVEGFTVTGYAGSTAEQYANTDERISFVALPDDGSDDGDDDDEPTETVPTNRVNNVKTTPSDVDVTLSWDAFDTATEYYAKVYDKNFTKCLKTITTKGTSAVFDYKLLSYNTDYKFIVTAKLSNGKYLQVADATRVDGALVVGNRVVGHTLKLEGKGAIIDFLPVSGAQEYMVNVFENNANGTRIYNASLGTATSARVMTNLSAGTKYVVMINVKLNGSWTALADLRVSGIGVSFTAPVYNPSSVTIAAETATSIRFNWDAVRGASQYFIKVTEKSTGKLVNTLNVVGKTTATLARYTDGTRISPNTTYILQFYTYINSTTNSGTYGEPIEITTIGYENVSISATKSGSKVNLSWNKTTNSIGYFVYTYKNGVKIANTYVDGKNNTTISLAAPTASGTYTYGVVAHEKNTSGTAYTPLATSNAIRIY